MRQLCMVWTCALGQASINHFKLASTFVTNFNFYVELFCLTDYFVTSQNMNHQQVRKEQQWCSTATLQVNTVYVNPEIAREFY